MIPGLIYEVEICGVNIRFLSTLLIELDALKKFPLLLQILSVTTVIEVLFSIITCIAYLPFFYVVCTCPIFHINLRRIIFVTVLHTFLAMVMRFVMMLYEFEVVTRTGDVIGDLPLVCAGLALLEQMAFLFWIFPMIIAERMFAMHFMWDYERNSRTWISTSILGVALVVSTIAALMMAICVLLIRDVFMFVGVPLCLGGIFGFVLTYRLVARQNSITLSNLEIGSSSYGLSAKYQAAENIKCFKLVRYFLLLSICADFFGASLVMISVLGSKTPTLETLIAGAIFEHWVTVFGIMFLGVAMYSVKEWRKRYLNILRIFNIKARVETPIEVTSPDYEHETAQYFNYYSRTW